MFFDVHTTLIVLLIYCIEFVDSIVDCVLRCTDCSKRCKSFPNYRAFYFFMSVNTYVYVNMRMSKHNRRASNSLFGHSTTIS